MVMLLIPLWILQEHGSAFAIGVDVAAVSVAPMFLAIPVGAAADRLGSRKIVFIGAMAATITTLLSISTANVWLFGFWQMIAGLGRSATWIGAQASVTREREEGSRRAHRIGLLSLSAQIGNFGGPFLAGLLIARASITTAFIVSAAAVALISFSIPPSQEPAVEKKEEKASPVPDAQGGRNFGRAFKLLALPSFRLIVIGSVVRLALIAIKNSFYVVYLHHLAWSPLAIGIVLSIGAATSAASAALNGVLYSRFDAQRLLYLSLIGMALVFSAVSFSSSFILQTACMLIFGIGNGMSQTALIGLLAKATPVEDQGLAVGLRTSVNRAVQVVAPMLFGVLVGVIVLPTLLFSLGMVSVAAMAGSAWFLRRPAEASTDSQP